MPRPAALALKIGVSGVRGIVGDSLTPQLAARFAAAFGTYVGRGRVVVARDARPSGPMLENAVRAGLLATGCQPVDIGICPIPSVLLYVKESGAAGGIAVTASHNPAEWNGLKFLSARGLYLTASEVAEFLDIYHQGEFSFAPADRLKPPLRAGDALQAHLARLLKALDVERIRKRRLRVAFDAGGGAGAALMPDFLAALGCEAIGLDAGGGARASEPSAENLGALVRLVRRERADVGFAQDADADRLALVDERGRPLGEELTLAFAVRRVLMTDPGPVVVNLSTSRAIDDLARRAGVEVFRTRVGESNVVEELRARGATIGGEGNGGVIWPRIHPCRDSFAAAGLALELAAATGKTISALRREIPRYAMVKDKVRGSAEAADRTLARLAKKYAANVASTLDGLKLAFGASWVHLRPSNTEPLIRVFAEARTPAAARALAARFRREIS